MFSNINGKFRKATPNHWDPIFLKKVSCKKLKMDARGRQSNKKQKNESQPIQDMILIDI